MPFNKLKDKISELAGNETLGSAKVEEVESKPKRKKQRPKPQGAQKVSGAPEVFDEIDDLFSVLGVPRKSNVNPKFTSGQIDYIAFSQSTPLGFDFDEVTDFLSEVKYLLASYEEAIESRDEDILKLAREIKKIEAKMVEQKQDDQLNMMMGEVSEEERLLQMNVELKMENEDLKNKLKTLSSTSRGNPGLQKEMEALRAENEMLRRVQAESFVVDEVIEEPEIDEELRPKPIPKPMPKPQPLPKPKAKPKIPSMDEIAAMAESDSSVSKDAEMDPFEAMLSNMEEDYNE